MTAKDSNFPIAEHDWQSQGYVDEWISRDVQRDGVRRTGLREMQEGRGVTPYRGRASAVCCFGLIIVTMQALAHDPCPMKAVRP